MKVELKGPYVSCHGKGGGSYGGSQTFSHRRFIRKSGCGLISATDLLLYLSGRAEERWNRETYSREAFRLCRRYFPIIPGLGMSGLEVTAGLNRCFKKNALPYRAYPAFSRRKLFSRMERMLAGDIPVILEIGPNFPLCIKKKKLNFYKKNSDGTYTVSTAVSGHFVNVTGMDDEWMCVSSWGKKFFIRKSEYVQYVRRTGTFFISNLVDIRRK